MHHVAQQWPRALENCFKDSTLRPKSLSLNHVVLVLAAEDKPSASACRSVDGKAVWNKVKAASLTAFAAEGISLMHPPPFSLVNTKSLPARGQHYLVRRGPTCRVFL